MGLRLILTAALCTTGCTDREPSSAAEPVVRFERSAKDEVKHGARLALVLGCVGCHGAALKGEDWSEPGFGRLWTANLTRSLEQNGEQAFISLIRTGRRPDRPLWEMPSHLFTQLAADDLAGLLAYVRSMPAQGRVHPQPDFERSVRREVTEGTYASSPSRSDPSERPGRRMLANLTG